MSSSVCHPQIHHISDNSRTIKALKSKIQSLQTTLEEQNSTLTDMQEKIDGMSDLENLEDKTHIETGRVWFGDSMNDWEFVTLAKRFATHNVTFLRPFASSPQIITSIERMYSTADKQFFFKTEVIASSEAGFTVECEIDHRYMSRMYYFQIYWMAVPTYE